MIFKPLTAVRTKLGNASIGRDYTPEIFTVQCHTGTKSDPDGVLEIRVRYPCDFAELYETTTVGRISFSIGCNTRRLGLIQVGSLKLRDAAGIPDSLRAALLELTLMESRLGPRMNYEAVRGGLGLADLEMDPVWVEEIMASVGRGAP